VDGKNMVYTYAIQKVREKYISYTNEYDLDEVYSNDWDTDKTEKVVVYENINDFLDNFTVKYDIIFNKFNVSKGQKLHQFLFGFIMINSRLQNWKIGILGGEVRCVKYC